MGTPTPREDISHPLPHSCNHWRPPGICPKIEGEKKIAAGRYKTLKKILTKQRIEHACTLIKSKNKNLEEISYLCGYTSYNGFLSAFKKFTGKSPKVYEKGIR